ncbi:hypothetical protein XF35_18340 [Streptomyces platensis subsp. clarensis]|nr:hypothetical protein [Streptomyces platensis subsp. clarensis]
MNEHLGDPLSLDVTRRTVRDALREDASGHPLPMLTQLQRLSSKVRIQASTLVPIVMLRLDELEADDPRRGVISQEFQRAWGLQGTRMTGNFLRDVATLRHLARLVSSLIDIAANEQQPVPSHVDDTAPDPAAARALQ